MGNFFQASLSHQVVVCGKIFFSKSTLRWMKQCLFWRKSWNVTQICLRLLSVLRRWFCCFVDSFLLLLHCLWGFCVWTLFCYAVLSVCPFLFCNHIDKEKIAFCFALIVFLVHFCGSSSRCRGLVCGVWLRYFLVILTYLFKSHHYLTFTFETHSFTILISKYHYQYKIFVYFLVVDKLHCITTLLRFLWSMLFINFDKTMSKVEFVIDLNIWWIN